MLYRVRYWWLGWRMDRVSRLWGKYEREANRLINLPREEFDQKQWHAKMDLASRYFARHSKLMRKFERLIRKQYPD